MTTYTYGELQTLWLDASKGTPYHNDPWARLMAAIALAESGGNPDATNPDDNNGRQTSWGLWQISLGNHRTPAPNWDNPAENAKLAIGKLESQGVTAWGTYTSGAYKRYMSGTGPSPVTGVTDSAAGGGLSWLEAPIKGEERLGKFIYGVINPVGGVASSTQSLGNIATGISGLVTTLSKIGQLFALLMRPQLWLRIGAFILGLFTFTGSIYFMVKAL